MLTVRSPFASPRRKLACAAAGSGRRVSTVRHTERPERLDRAVCFIIRAPSRISGPRFSRVFWARRPGPRRGESIATPGPRSQETWELLRIPGSAAKLGYLERNSRLVSRQAPVKGPFQAPTGMSAGANIQNPPMERLVDL